MLVFHWVSGRLRIIECRLDKKKINIKRSFDLDIPQGDFWNRGEQELRNIKDSLYMLIKENKIKEKDVYLSFENKDISMRIVEYPKMNPKEIESAILDDLIEFQGFDPETSSFTFIKLSEDKEKQKVAIFTIPKIVLEVWKRILKDLNLNLFIFEPTSLSALRTISFLLKDPIDCVIFIGNENTDLFFISNRKLDSLINISVGVNDLIYSIENINLEPAVISWNEEISTYINSYFLNRDIKKPKILIAGEDERFVFLAQNLMQSLNENIEVYSELNTLLVGSIIEDKFIPKVNFIRGRILLDKELVFRTAISAVLALSLLFPINFYLDVKSQNINNRIKSLQMEIDKYNQEIGNLRAKVDEENLVLITLESWLEKRSAMYFPFVFLVDLKHLVPKNVWLSSLEISPDKKLIIDGYSLDTSGVADFLFLLSNYERIKNVKLESSILEILGNNREVQRFRILGVLK